MSLRTEVQFDNAAGETALFLSCPNRRQRERVPVNRQASGLLGLAGGSFLAASDINAVNTSICFKIFWRTRNSFGWRSLVEGGIKSSV